MCIGKLVKFCMCFSVDYLCNIDKEEEVWSSSAESDCEQVDEVSASGRRNAR